jgi:hypothetical protein
MHENVSSTIQILLQTPPDFNPFSHPPHFPAATPAKRDKTLGFRADLW